MFLVVLAINFFLYKNKRHIDEKKVFYFHVFLLSCLASAVGLSAGLLAEGFMDDGTSSVDRSTLIVNLLATISFYFAYSKYFANFI